MEHLSSGKKKAFLGIFGNCTILPQFQISYDSSGVFSPQTDDLHKFRTGKNTFFNSLNLSVTLLLIGPVKSLNLYNKYSNYAWGMNVIQTGNSCMTLCYQDTGIGSLSNSMPNSMISSNSMALSFPSGGGT